MGRRRKRLAGFRASEWQDPFIKLLLEPTETIVNGKKNMMSAYDRWIGRIIVDALNGKPESFMILLKESDNLGVLIDPELREPSSADLLYIENVKRAAALLSLEQTKDKE